MIGFRAFVLVATVAAVLEVAPVLADVVDWREKHGVVPPVRSQGQSGASVRCV